MRREIPGPLLLFVLQMIGSWVGSWDEARLFCFYVNAYPRKKYKGGGFLETRLLELIDPWY